MSLHQLFSAHNYFQEGHFADSFIAFGISFVHRNHGIISKTQFFRCIENLEFSTSYVKKKMLELHPKFFTSYSKLLRNADLYVLDESIYTLQVLT